MFDRDSLSRADAYEDADEPLSDSIAAALGFSFGMTVATASCGFLRGGGTAGRPFAAVGRARAGSNFIGLADLAAARAAPSRGRMAGSVELILRRDALEASKR